MLRDIFLTMLDGYEKTAWWSEVVTPKLIAMFNSFSFIGFSFTLLAISIVVSAIIWVKSEKDNGQEEEVLASK